MDHKHYPMDNSEAGVPGTGRPGDGSPSALFVCPTCHRFGSLTDHSIDADGVVSPSVGCSYDDGCTFHEFIQLDGWREYQQKKGGDQIGSA